MRRFFEDIEPNETGETGSYTVTETEIVDFAAEYDPQPFHLDPGHPETEQHGGLIASGYHTLSITNKLLVDGHRGNVASIAGLGLDELRWKRPVRPGDTITVGYETIDYRDSESHPHAGIIKQRITARNQNGDTVLTYIDAGLIKRRPVGD